VRVSDNDGKPPFSETLRLPGRFLRWWITVNIIVTIFFAWLWSIATMSAGQRVLTAVVLVLMLVYFWGAALWFVAAHVVVRGEQLTRRVGHRRTRTDLSDITATRVDPGSEWASKVVLTLRDGTEREIPTRRPDDLLQALTRNRAATIRAK
jgi:hypothetical protein